MFLSRSAWILLTNCDGEDPKICHNLTFFSIIVPKNLPSSSFFDFSFFRCICALFSGSAFIPAAVTYIILFFLPNITFHRFFSFFLDHKISHISCWKQKIKAHYAELRFQVCGISTIFDVVFTIAAQNLHSGYERSCKHQDRTTERVVGGGKIYSLHSNFNKPPFHGSQVG